MRSRISADELLAKHCDEIGLVVSGASASYAPVQLFKRSENRVFEEDLVLIKDSSVRDVLLLGVIRRIQKFEPLIRERIRSPFIDRPELLDQTILMPFTVAHVRLYSSINLATCNIEEINHIPTPGSKAYVIRDGGFLKNVVRVSKPITLGYHKYSGWEIPLDLTYVSYHVGVFGSTGMGKSRLVRLMIEELVRSGLKVIVFDHTGVDYVPHFKDYAISSKAVRILPPTIASVLAEKSRLSWQTFGEYLEVACITYVTGKRLYKGGKIVERPDGETRWSKQDFINHMVSTMRALNAKDQTIEKARLFIDYFVSDEFFNELNNRKVEALDIISRALERGLLVIDLSDDPDLPVKQGIVRDVIEAAWSIVLKERRPLGMAFVIDEAQNYVPEREWTICGDVIETTAREGRKWGLSLVVASQRVASDIRVGIRANLGTVFFSRLTAQSDLREIGSYLDLADVTESTLAQLGVREFFVAGLLNPFRKPLLMKVREVV